MKKRIIEVFKHNEIYLFFVIVFFALVVNTFNKQFLTFGNIINLLRSNAASSVLALGFFIVLLSGGIDVSFMAITTVSMYVTVTILTIINGSSILLAFFIAGVIGIILGAINASVIAGFKISTLITTLATLNIFYGLLVGLIVLFGMSTHIAVVPEYFSTFRNSMVLTLQNDGSKEIGIPYTILIVIIIYIITWFVLKYSTLGRSLYVIGGNMESATRIGFNTRNIQFFVYCYSGFLAGIASVLHVSQLKYVNVFALVGKELGIIAMVIIGGAALAGGKGSVIGTFLGVLLLMIVNNSLILIGVPTIWNSVAIGLIVVVSVIITTYRNKDR